MNKKVKGGNDFLTKYAVILVWIAIFIIFSVLKPKTFFTWVNVSTMLSSKAVLVVLSLAVMVPLIANDFDLSAASVLVLSNMVIAVLNVKLGLSLAICIPAALAVGAVVGVINGFFVVKIGINPFIVTLGVGTILDGITLWISRSRTITGIDYSLQRFFISTRIFKVSLIFFFALIICAILYYYLEHTANGKKILYVGRGQNVARLSGINVGKVRWLCLVASGVLSSVAGIMYAGVTASGDPTSGLTFMMPAFAGAFFGSTCVKPGRFNPWGCMIAIYFLVTGVTGFSILGVSTFIQDLFYGAALVVAVTFSAYIKKRQDNVALIKGSEVLRKNLEKNRQ